MTVPFDTYEGMTQQQFQDSTSPFCNHGKLVSVSVPKGWRRVEAPHPGKHFYVHTQTGSISTFPKETYDCKRECWLNAAGEKISTEELAMHPEDRTLMLAYKDGPPPTAPTAKEPAAKKKVEKPKDMPALEAAPAAAAEEP